MSVDRAVHASEPSTELTLAQTRIATLEAEQLSAARAEHERVIAERDTLREAYTAVQLEFELLKKRLLGEEKLDLQHDLSVLYTLVERD